MEIIAGSRMDDRLTPEQERSGLVLVPKTFLISPFFAAKPQIGERKITVGHRHYHIGGFHPLDDTQHPPALDVRHARAIFSLLSFRKDQLDKTQLIRFSFNQFCQCYAKSNGGRYARAIKKILRDLTNSFIRITDDKTGIGHQYRLIERLDIETRPIRRKDARLANSPQLEMWFNSCTLSPEFADLLSDIDELQHLRFDVLNSIRSPLAQAIYLYIPSRAYYHNSEHHKPFEITLTRLLEQVSWPKIKHKSKREELFTKHENEGRSIIQQLDGLETLNGRFRIQLVETNDGTDFKAKAWVETNPGKPKRLSGKSKLIKAWTESGRSRELLEECLAHPEPLNDYERELLEKAEVRIEGNERFFTMAKAMLPLARFVSLLGEAKGDAQEGRKAKTNPTARLIWRIKSAISEPVKAETSRPAGLDNGGK